MRWAPAFMDRTATKLCAMIGKAVACRTPLGPTRAEAPERSGRRSLIHYVHACHHARGELRVCQARIMHIQRRGRPDRCHVRTCACSILSTWRNAICGNAVRTTRCHSLHIPNTRHVSNRRIGSKCAASAILLHHRRLAFASVLLLVSTGGNLSRGNATNSVGPSFFEANGYKT